VVDLSNVSLSDLAAATGDVDFGNNKGVNVADPDANQDAATKKYHDDHKYTDAEAVAAAEAETELDLGIITSTTQHRCRIKPTVNVSHSQYWTWTVFNEEVYDVGNLGDLNNNRIVIQKTGFYLVVAQSLFYASVGGSTYLELTVNFPNAGWYMLAYNVSVGDDALNSELTNAVATIQAMNQNDFIRMRLYNSDATPKTMGHKYTYLAVVRLF